MSSSDTSVEEIIARDRLHMANGSLEFPEVVRELLIRGVAPIKPQHVRTRTAVREISVEPTIESISESKKRPASEISSDAPTIETTSTQMALSETSSSSFVASASSTASVVDSMSDPMPSSSSSSSSSAIDPAVAQQAEAARAQQRQAQRDHNESSSSSSAESTAPGDEQGQGQDDEDAADEDVKSDQPSSSSSSAGVGSSDGANKKPHGSGLKKKPKFGAPDSERLCPYVSMCKVCPFPDCRMSHDVKAFLAKKEPDLGPRCYTFDTYGRCLQGYGCRFGNAHINLETGAMISNPKPEVSVQESLNHVPEGLGKALRKRQFKWIRSSKLPAAFDRFDKVQKQQTANVTWVADKPSTSDAALAHLAAASSSSSPSSAAAAVAVAALSTKETSASSTVVAAVAAAATAPSSSSSSSSSSTPSFDTSPYAGLSASAVAALLPSPPTRTPDLLATECFELVDATKGTQSRLVPLWSADRAHSLPWLRQSGMTVLAPLTTVGNLPFRRLCKRLGVDVTIGEMAMATNLLAGQQSEWALLRRHPSEDKFGVQIAGSHVDSLARCVELVNEHVRIKPFTVLWPHFVEADFIDLNCGCPIDLIVNKGNGSGLLQRPRRLESLLRSMTQASSRIPVTMKMRIGFEDDKLLATDFIPFIRRAGIAALTIHGRTREQRYTRLANWDYVADCVRVARTPTDADLADAERYARPFQPLPVIGNGDIYNFVDYERRLEEAPFDAVMIGRGALIKPWLFTEIRERRHWDISGSERMDILRDYCNYGLEHWGSDTKGVHNTRKFLLEFLSFFHRYVPYGLLEVLPPQMSWRPPPLIGRDDRETLLASANPADWVKITELFLGKVPAGFNFEAKHRSNSYGKDSSLSANELDAYRNMEVQG